MIQPPLSSFSYDREFTFSDKEFARISHLANQLTGIQLPARKKDMVYARLARRLRALHLDDFASYFHLLESEEGKEELGNLINALTTNLTHFFREGHHFEHLRDRLLVPLHHQGKRKLRIWSAGCSSGMEPYSIAMTMQHSIPHLDAWDARILATDIDTSMLDKGVTAHYPLEEYRNIPKDYHQLITLSQHSIEMKPCLQKLIAFKYLNLLESWKMRGVFDAIFCRNVVIYFDKPTQTTLFKRMSDYLAPHGFLYIGHSENITAIAPQFETVGRTIYQHKGAKR